VVVTGDGDVWVMDVWVNGRSRNRIGDSGQVSDFDTSLLFLNNSFGRCSGCVPWLAAMTFP